MATGLLNFLTPAGANPTQTVQYNPYFPGTNIPAQVVNDMGGFKSKDNSDLFAAMLWRESGGLSGAPMPAAAPENPLNALARAQGASSIAKGNAYMAARGQPGSTATRYTGPQVNPVVQRALGGGGMVKPGLTTTIKSPAQQSRLNANLTQFAGPVAQAKTNSLSQYTKDFLDDRKRQKDAYDQESGFIDRTFAAGGLEADLAANAKQRSLLARQAAESAIRRAGRDANLSRMVNGGVSSSYLDRAYGDTLGRILTDRAIQGADLGRENIMYLQGARSGMTGRRAQLGDAYVDRALSPYAALTDMQAADLENLGRIGNLEDNYSIYDYVRPDEAARRNLGMLGDLDQTYNLYGA
jgi:hypothetical protein